MPDDKGHDESTPEAQETSEPAKCNTTEELPPRSLAGLLTKTLDAIEARLLSDTTLKPTLAEYLKLLQIERELEPELPREITVRWVESPSPLKEK
jgi:hypothetical protein